MFSLAAIRESGGTSPGAVDTFVILTMAAAPAIADIHHRQPLILDDDAAGEWLRPGPAPVDVITRAKKDCGSMYDCWPVSALVNSPRNHSPEVLELAMKLGLAGSEERTKLALLWILARRLTVRLCGRTLRGPGYSRLSEGGQ